MDCLSVQEHIVERDSGQVLNVLVVVVLVKGGVVLYLPTYAVRVAIHQFPAKTIKVVARSGEPWVLLGRDVLNAHRLFLNGPQLTFEIG